MESVFNPNVTTFQSNCSEGLHFSAFHHNSNDNNDLNNNTCTVILLITMIAMQGIDGTSLKEHWKSLVERKMLKMFLKFEYMNSPCLLDLVLIHYSFLLHIQK